MKRTLLAAAALALPITMSACSTAALNSSEQAVVESNVQYSEAVQAEVKELNELTRIYIDAVNLYQQAANTSKDLYTLKPELVEMAQTRNNQRAMLQDRVIAMGAKPAEYGETFGTVRRSLTSLRSVVGDKDDVAIQEVLRGERYILQEINRAMDTAVTPESRTLLGQLRTDTDAQIARLLEIEKTV